MKIKILSVIIILLLLVIYQLTTEVRYWQNEVIENEKEYATLFDEMTFDGGYASYICFSGKDSNIIKCK